MKVEVWEDVDSISVFESGDPNKELLLGDEPKLLYSVEGEDWNDCVQKVYDKQGWGTYKPLS